MVTNIENNKCGECTMCCEVLPIPEIDKPVSTPCTNCTLNGGCNIYNERPQSCVNFNCLYINSNEMKLELRPDYCNVIFERITTKIYLAINHYTNPIAYENKKVVDYIRKLNREGISVVTTSFTNHPRGMFLAEEHTEEGVLRVISNIVNI